MVIYKIFVFGADRKSNIAAIGLVVSNKKIFKISTNQNTLWALAAMLDFRSAPKTKFLYMTIQ
jgi:acetyl/propionyl-CoA carboxylase alpha subunit